MKKRLIILIHGATNRRQGISKNLLNLKNKLKEVSPYTDEYIQYEWSEYIQPMQDELYLRRFLDHREISILSPIKKLINIIRKEIIFGFAADSISYEKTLKKKVVPLFEYKIKSLYMSGEYDEIYIIAWSMGAAISYDVIKQLVGADSELLQKINLITMGCNIPLNYLEDYFVPTKLKSWHNIAHEWDTLGMSLERPKIKEHTYKTFRPFTAHNGYFYDKKCFNIIMDILGV